MTETAAALPAPASPALRLKTAPGRWTVTATVLGSGMAALDATANQTVPMTNTFRRP